MPSLMARKVVPAWCKPTKAESAQLSQRPATLRLAANVDPDVRAAAVARAQLFGFVVVDASGDVLAQPHPRETPAARKPRASRVVAPQRRAAASEVPADPADVPGRMPAGIGSPAARAASLAAAALAQLPPVDADGTCLDCGKDRVTCCDCAPGPVDPANVPGPVQDVPQQVRTCNQWGPWGPDGRAPSAAELAGARADDARTRPAPAPAPEDGPDAWEGF